jgi:signal transduction histidine kinase
MQKDKVSILIVDDQPSVRDVLKGFLLQETYELAFAANGQEALAVFETVQPDLVLLDVMMPGMDGFEVCQQIKSVKAWHHIPIILVTALDSKEDMAHGLDSGADDFLSKPINPIELRARVRSLLRIKRQFDELQATMQLREDLAAMIVHDMRGSITPILGRAELMLLRSKNLSPAQIEDLNSIRENSYSLNTFLNDILMLAKMEQGALMIHRSSVNINHLVQQATDHHALMVRSRNIELTTDLPPTGRELSLDANLFRRLLDNLISNALKFSPGESTVTIRVAYPEHEAQLRLQVIDEGPGVPLAYRHSIFERFKIVELKHKNISQVGLGLTFCKLVAEAHGGRIYVSDNEPTGAVFTVEV